MAQHRNYGEIMARHEKEARIKRVIRVFIYFLIILFMIVIFVLVRQIQEKPEVRKTKGPDSARVETFQQKAAPSDGLAIIDAKPTSS